MDEPAKPELIPGVVLGHVANYRELNVRLADGRELIAMLPTTKLRQIGCFPPPLIGWAVEVRMRPEPKMPRVIRLTPPPKATSGTNHE